MLFLWSDISEIWMDIMSCHGFPKLTTSRVVLTCLSALVTYYFWNRFVIVDKVDEVFVNILGPVLKQINDSPLHNKDSLWCVKHKLLFFNIEKNVITKYVYTNLSLFIIMTVMLNPRSNSLNILSNNILTNLSIQPSSLNGFRIWTHLIIWNRKIIIFTIK